MENQLVPNNVTLAGLRRLLAAARSNAAPEEAVHVELKMWDYGIDTSDGSNGRITERIGVYRSRTGEGSRIFKNLKEAHKYIVGWKEEKTDASKGYSKGNSSS